MLRVMGLVAMWDEISRKLPADWQEARLRLLPDAGRSTRAAALLGPLGPGRVAGELRLAVSRRGSPGPEQLRRLLARLDEERIGGRLELLTAVEAEVEGERDPRPKPSSLAAEWDRLTAALPEDWSDLLCHLQLHSSDDLDPSAVALAPVNPTLDGLGFRFRVACRFGYGAAPEMARRCLARLDEAGIPGELRVLDALADTKPIGTQGPVFIVARRAV